MPSLNVTIREPNYVWNYMQIGLKLAESVGLQQEIDFHYDGKHRYKLMIKWRLNGGSKPRKE
jgi:hypothetical protein